MVRLKCLHDAAIKMFHTGNSTALDRDDKRERSIYLDLYRRLVNGSIDVVTPVDMNGTIYTLTRSTRSAGIVKTCFLVKNGEFLALSHDDIDTPKKAEKMNLPSGVYNTIAF